MNLTLLEPFPILRHRIEKELKKLNLEKTVRLTPRGETADLVICDLNRFPPRNCPNSELYFISGQASVQKPLLPGFLISGGMSSWDAVTFSSIGEDRAMLCLQQEITLLKKSIVPFEKSVPYDRNYPLFQNLATGFCLSLAEQLFGEEL